MNVEAIDRTIAAIEAAPEGQFDMGGYFNECGTPACIAGFVLTAHGEDGTDGYLGTRAAELLGLSQWQKDHLFEPSSRIAFWRAERGWSSWISREHALACLRHLRKTGKVSWAKTKPR